MEEECLCTRRKTSDLMKAEETIRCVKNSTTDPSITQANYKKKSKKVIKNNYNLKFNIENEIIGDDGQQGEKCIRRCGTKCKTSKPDFINVRKRKWLIADIANYLSKRLTEFLKHESDMLSCAIQKF